MLIYNGISIAASFPVEAWAETPELALRKEDYRVRPEGAAITAIVLHNTKNVKTKLRPGLGESTSLGSRISRLWSTDGRHAGAHLSVDWNGAVSCHADIKRIAAYHAGAMNENSVGIEIYEDHHGVVYEGQLIRVCELVELLCDILHIQKQMPRLRDTGVITRVASGNKSLMGVFGHCHNKSTKPNDPGKDIFKFLRARGFQEFDYKSSEDLITWARIHTRLGLNTQVVPNVNTYKAVTERYGHGLLTAAEFMELAAK